MPSKHLSTAGLKTGFANKAVEPEREFRSRAEWRAWLKRNHAKVPALWLVFLKKHTGKPSVRYEEAVQEALCFGWIDGKIRRIDDERYAQRFTPRRKGSNWSALNRRRADRLIKEGLMMPAGLAEVEKAKANGRWADAGQAGPKVVDIPAELAQALDRRPGLRAVFERLSPRCRAEYAMWIGNAKQPETRERRVAQALGKIGREERLGMV